MLTHKAKQQMHASKVIADTDDELAKDSKGRSHKSNEPLEVLDNNNTDGCHVYNPL